MPGRPREQGWTSVERILCIRLDSVGDVLMTTPAIRAVKESLPGTSVTLMTSPAGAAAAALVLEVDDLIIYDAPWMKATRRRVDASVDRGLIECLRQRGYDAAIIFTVATQSALPAALMCYLADIPLRLAHCRENPYQILTDWVPETEPDHPLRHEVRRQLDLVKRIGCRASDEHLRVHVPDWAKRAAWAILDELHLSQSRRWVVMHVGATAPSRRYPPENFAEAANVLATEHDVRIVFTGADSEADLVQEVRRVMNAPSVSLAGLLTMQELAALLSMCPVLVANNTGPVHLAAAVGTPVVDLYALTNPQHAPWGVPSRVLYQDVPCKFCFKSTCPEGHHQCLTRVSPETLVQATLDLLERRGRRRDMNRGLETPSILTPTLSC